MTSPADNPDAVFARLIDSAAALALAWAAARRIAPASRWRSARLVWPLFTGDR